LTQTTPPGSIEAAFQQAAQAHRQGRLQEAAQLYQTVLRHEPRHAGALHCLGFICNQLGRFGDAAVLLRKTVEADPQSARAHCDLGIAFQGLERQEEAAAQYRQALALAPDLLEARNNLGNALRALGRAAEAAAAFEAALALRPESAETHNNFGIALMALARRDEAIAHYREALARHPGFAEAHNNLGMALATGGRVEEAIAQYRRAVACKPRYALAYNNLGNALMGCGRRDEAVEQYQSAIDVAPEHPDGHANLGNALTALGRPTEAIEPLTKAAALKPADAGLRIGLGNVLAMLGREAEAVAQFEQALAIAPDSAEAHNNLGNALSALDRHMDAVGHYQSAIAIGPDLAEPHCNLGDALLVAGRTEDAIACYDRALAIDPGLAIAHGNRGSALSLLGSLGEARAALETAVGLAPRRIAVHRTLADLKQYQPGDAHLALMEELLSDAATLSASERAELHFALGKAYADIGEPRKAFDQWREGNALFRGELVYDEAERLATFDRIAAVFTPEFIASHKGIGHPSVRPIFIIGMPRSGTTLVEQVLASHPMVSAAGETQALFAAIEAVAKTKPEWLGFPDDLAHMGKDDLRRIAEEYLARLPTPASEAVHVTDKMPANFFCVGLIHLILPNARIIRLCRDPIDTCLSSWSRLFPSTLPYSYDLGELGRYHRAYDRLIAHWGSVLPEDAMLAVRYESFVADFEPEARRLLAYCGLHWDDGCARFYETRRTVRTASAAQVRQPIYQTSVGRSRPYREMLGPLLEALAMP
jgi:tetratricopeptide (TPR) repeat protein